MNGRFAPLRGIACLMIRVLIVSASLGVGTKVSGDLQPKIRVDRHWLQAKRLIDEKDYLGALDALDSLKVMSDSNRVRLPEAFQLMVAQAALPAGRFRCAETAVKCYLNETGTLGGQYEKALRLLDDIKRAKPEMVRFNAGCIQTSCSTKEKSTANEAQADIVPVGSFYISRHEVTFEQYDRFVAATGYSLPGDCGWGRGRRPVIRVSYADAVAYTQWLSWVTGDCYSLPTEDQWLYAACADSTKCSGRKKGCSKGSPSTHICKRRAGNQTCIGESNRVGYNGPQNAEKTAPVGSFEANPCGLYDMYGNVSEWVLDCRNDSSKCDAVIRKVRESGDCSRHIARGGSWNSGPSLCRPEKLTGKSNEEKSSKIGFRVVRSANTECEKKKSDCCGRNKASCKKRTREPKCQ